MVHLGPILMLALAEIAVFARLVFRSGTWIIPWDFRSAVAPWLIYGWDAIRAGVAPLWCPFVAAGSPFYLNPQTQIYSPLSLLLGGLFGYSYRMAQLHTLTLMLLGGIGAYALAFSVWRERAPALLAGLCYQLCGVLYGHFSHGPMLASFALAPWLFLSLVLVLDRRSRWGLPLLAGTVFWLFTAGYAGVILTLALWGAAFALLLAWRQPLLPAARVRLLGGCVAAVGLGCAMAAVNWLPFAVRVGELTRGAALSADVVLSPTHSLQPKHLLSLLLPFFPVVPFPGTEVDITFRGIYLGGVALSLAVVCVTWSRGFIVAALAGAAVGSLLMSLGGNFFGRVALHAMVPLFNFSQYPAGDSTFLAMLALSLLAAGGAVLLARAHAPSLALARRALRSLLVLYLVSVVGLTLVYGKYDDRVVSGVTFEAFCMLLALVALERGRGARLYPLLAGLALLELGYSAMVNFDVAGQPMPTAEYRRLLDSRVTTFSGSPPAGPRLGDPKALSAQSSSIAFLDKSYYVSEYNPARLKTYEALVAGGFVPWLKDGPRVVALPPDGSPPEFAAFKARVSDVTFSILEYMPNRLRYAVQVPNDALLVLNEVYFPGWRATVDGVPTPVRPAAGGLRALPIRAGSHQVELRFRPIEYFVALALSLGGLVAFVAWLVVVARRRPAPAVADPASPLMVGVRAVETVET